MAWAGCVAYPIGKAMREPDAGISKCTWHPTSFILKQQTFCLGIVTEHKSTHAHRTAHISENERTSYLSSRFGKKDEL